MFFNCLFAQMEAVNFQENKKAIKESKKQWKVGDVYFSMRNYKKALEHYLLANEINEFDAILNYKIGSAYLHSSDFQQSVNFFLKAKRLRADIDLEILNNPILREDESLGVDYSLGIYYAMSLEFDLALEAFQNYQSEILSESFKDLVDLDLVQNNVEKRQAECTVGKRLVKSPKEVKVESMDANVNSPYKDYGPVITADESVMYFTSRRANNSSDELIVNTEANYFEDVYVSYNEMGKWSKAENLGSPINTELHDATIGLSVDGQKMFVYRNMDIFYAELKGEFWEETKPASKIINSDYWESSICFSPDEKTIYFVSNREGSFGGKDIFMTTFNASKGEWNHAKNIGPTINTEYDEDFVFIHPDGKTMYFSSKGHENMGGHDIFKSVLEAGVWSQPENLGYPINTPGDDISFVLSANGDRGYFASDRLGGFGDWDVLMVTFMKNKKESELVLLKGSILDQKTGAPIEAEITVTDNEKNEIVGEYRSNKKTGKFLLALPAGKNYGLAIEKDDYLFHSENFIVKSGDQYKEFVTEVNLQKITEGSSTILNNIFFKTNSSNVADESLPELEKLAEMLMKKMTLEIELGGHTDNVGSESFNQNLSEKRAKGVYDTLIKLGVNANQLKYIGYGFSKPIASNDTEEGRSKNRRLEVKIIKK